MKRIKKTARVFVVSRQVDGAQSVAAVEFSLTAANAVAKAYQQDGPAYVLPGLIRYDKITCLEDVRRLADYLERNGIGAADILAGSKANPWLPNAMNRACAYTNDTRCPWMVVNYEYLQKSQAIQNQYRVATTWEEKAQLVEALNNLQNQMSNRAIQAGTAQTR